MPHILTLYLFFRLCSGSRWPVLGFVPEWLLVWQNPQLAAQDIQNACRFSGRYPGLRGCMHRGRRTLSEAGLQERLVVYRHSELGLGRYSCLSRELESCF